MSCFHQHSLFFVLLLKCSSLLFPLERSDLVKAHPFSCHGIQDCDCLWCDAKTCNHHPSSFMSSGILLDICETLNLFWHQLYWHDWLLVISTPALHCIALHRDANLALPRHVKPPSLLLFLIPKPCSFSWCQNLAPFPPKHLSRLHFSAVWRCWCISLNLSPFSCNPPYHTHTLTFVNFEPLVFVL